MGNNKLSYSEYYRKKYKRDFAKKPEKTPEIDKTQEKAEEVIEKKLEKAYEESDEPTKQPKYIKVLKIIVILIVLGILGYLVYSNFIASHEFTYFYDIGGEEDKEKPYLSPAGRVSDIIIEEVNYRAQIGHLVYFNAPITNGFETVYVAAKIKDNFPNNSKMSIGASDNSTAWHYKWHPVYNQTDSNTGEWINVETEFNIKQENLSIKNNQLSIIFNVPYLNQNSSQYSNFSNYTIPIDWIKIIVYKSGII